MAGANRFRLLTRKSPLRDLDVEVHETLGFIGKKGALTGADRMAGRHLAYPLFQFG